MLVLLKEGMVRPGSAFEAELRQAVKLKSVVFVCSMEHGWDLGGTAQNELKAAIVTHEALMLRSKTQRKHGSASTSTKRWL